ncbi:MAG: citramalate synthase [Corynebacteriales bacterium]|nr:citramalate synthase [Mycobacteriales bacterium]
MTSPSPQSFQLYDTTLRDGAQAEGISYSVSDKLAVAKLLDEFGVGFIEGGWPGAMPKDTEFFQRALAGELALKNAQLVAFGATRKAGTKVTEDRQVAALLESGAPVVTLVAKSDVRHVEQALRTTTAENLAMVADTVAYLVEHGRRVFLDCEHFFDGYQADRDYGLRVIEAAVNAGAELGVLCDTNGGMLPLGVYRTVLEVRQRGGFELGIHCQDDTACAVANTLAAVEAGATHAQCTANGYGERTGNADLFAVAAALETKMNLRVLPPAGLAEMVRVSHAIAEIANMRPNNHQAYVGASAFAHKAGLHASAIKVNPELYNHMEPGAVGNDMRILVTEMAGRASIELKARELGMDLTGHPEVVSGVTEKVKTLEAQGWSFEAADASFELLVRSEVAGEVRAPFFLESYRASVENRAGEVISEATVKVLVPLDEVGESLERVIATAEGNGPVSALDHALRQALSRRYPELAKLELADYKVRILDGRAGTDAVTRVLIDTSDGTRTWTTVGVHDNVIEASWLALVDSLTYGLPRPA